MIGWLQRILSLIIVFLLCGLVLFINFLFSPGKNEVNEAVFNWMNESGTLDFIDEMAEYERQRPKYLGMTFTMWIALTIILGILIAALMPYIPIG